MFGSQHLRAVCASVLLAASVAGQARPGDSSDLQIRDRVEWLHQARWGVMIHYLGQPEASAQGWSAYVDQFDVNALADQLRFAGAGYLVITIGQNSGHFIAPNPTYDGYTGIQPSKCSRRDLVSDLAEALNRNGIRLIVYLPAAPPETDTVAVKKFGWRKGPYRNSDFQVKWEKVIADWSRRWGTKVSGWWFDGVYWPNSMYRHEERPNFASFAEAARAGNPRSIVAFNGGVNLPVISITPEEDYTAGEINDPLSVSCPGQWQDGAQWHMLSYLGERWSGGNPRFSVTQVAPWTAAQVAKGGAITWDVPADGHGLIGQNFLAQLKAIGLAVSGK